MKLFDIIIEHSDNENPFEEPNIDNSDEGQLIRYERTIQSLRDIQKSVANRLHKLIKSGVIDNNWGSPDRKPGNSHLTVVQAGQANKSDPILEYTFWVDQTKHNSTVINKIKRMCDRYAKMYKTTDRLEKRAKLLQRRINQAELDNQKNQAENVQIPVDQIPMYIEGHYFRGTDRLNPYFYGDNKYAGSPAHFNWPAKSKTEYLQLTKIMKEHGIAPFTMVYASTVIPDSQYTHRPKTHFVAINEDGTLVWWCSVTNYIFINGHSKKLSRFLTGDKQLHSRLLSRIKPKAKP